MAELLLSFDIEEFDVPLENGKSISFTEQINRSKEGTEKILELLKKHNVNATLFCTAAFAENVPTLIKQAVADGHEIASHGYSHSTFDIEDLKRSKETLQEICGTAVNGFRMARMKHVDAKDIYAAGYRYDSSLNPTMIPGRYNNLSKPRTYFKDGNLIELPSSVTPYLRFPLFWLALHNLPLFTYKLLLDRTLKYDGYAVVYFHPWEFTDIKSVKNRYALSSLMTNNSGNTMLKRLDSIIKYQKEHGTAFGTISSFLDSQNII